MEDIDLHIINRKLAKVNEKKIKNSQALSKHDQLEQDIHEIDIEGSRVFNWISDTWSKDREFIMQLEDLNAEYEQNRRRVQIDLESKKDSLRNEKRKLQDSEDGLIYLKYAYEQEDVE